MQRVKRFIPVELTLYLPTPDTRHTALPLSKANNVGSRIRYYRLQKGISQANLASNADVSLNYIVKLENNRISNPNPFLIQNIAKALELSPLRLITSTTRNSRKEDFIDYLVPPTSLGARIKNLRLKQKMTLKEFTKKVGLSKDSVWRYEKNIAIPNREILQRIAKTLKVNVTKLERSE